LGFFFIENMLKIGLTGGIGSGKTTVAKVFEVLGIPVYYADDAAKKLVNTDRALKAKIIEAFGNESYAENQLNRKFIANIVFNNEEKLKLLNTFIHPVTIADGIKWMNKQNAPYAIKEAAILFETGSDKGLDYIIGVAAPLPLRISRAMERDNVLAAEIEKRIARQMNEEDKLKRCNFVINNDNFNPIIPQVLAIHKQLLSILQQ
jgi:dephospho-CoA kinase